MNVFDEPLLISLLKRNSQPAFRQLYDHYAGHLFTFCMQYTHSRETSEELVEDTFVWLWRNRQSIRQDTTLKSILFTRTRHYIINAYRKTVNAPVFEDYIDYLGQFEDRSFNHLEYDEFQKAVNKAIDSLPETQRKVIRMSRIEMMRIKEIAQTLGLKEQTVKNQLSLATKTLRRTLRQLYVIFIYFSFIKVLFHFSIV